MAKARSDQPRTGLLVPRDSDRRGADRRRVQQPFEGKDRREDQRRSGRDRRDG